eukprot:gene15153-biopygen15228
MVISRSWRSRCSVLSPFNVPSPAAFSTSRKRIVFELNPEFPARNKSAVSASVGLCPSAFCMKFLNCFLFIVPVPLLVLSNSRPSLSRSSVDSSFSTMMVSFKWSEYSLSLSASRPFTVFPIMGIPSRTENSATEERFRPSKLALFQLRRRLFLRLS